MQFVKCCPETFQKYFPRIKNFPENFRTKSKAKDLEKEEDSFRHSLGKKAENRREQEPSTEPIQNH